MPLKYFAGQPGAVKVAGWIHGLLFIVFCGALLRTIVVARWPLARAALVFVAALLPFGPFVVDRRMKEYAEEFAPHR
jgi:integral membrane protein